MDQSEVCNILKRDIKDFKVLNRFIDLVSASTNFASSDNLPGHITCSALVVSGNKTLLTHHKKLHRWLQLGGHCEAQDKSLHEAALREASEESGLSDLKLVEPNIFDVDIHLIPASPKASEHYHYDVRFLLETQSPDSISISNESHDLKWFTAEEVNSLDTDESVLRLIRKWQSKMFRI